MQLARKGLLLTVPWVTHPGLEGVISALVKPSLCIVSLSLCNLLFERNLLCKGPFSAYKWGWSLHQGS